MWDTFLSAAPWLIAAAGAVMMLSFAARFCLRHLRRRFARLEDTLRVYNNTNASLGKQLLAMEAELQELRRALHALQSSATTKPSGAQATAVPLPRHAVPAAETEAFSEAELRLASLLKSRLRNLRLN